MSFFDSGVQTSIHYPTVHHFRIYNEKFQKRGLILPFTQEVAVREMTLPLYLTMSNEQVHWVVQAVKEALQELKAG